MTKLIYFNLYNSVILISFLRIMMTDIYKYIFTYWIRFKTSIHFYLFIFIWLAQINFHTNNPIVLLGCKMVLRSKVPLIDWCDYEKTINN